MDRRIEELRARIVDGQRRGVRQHPREVRAAAAELAATERRRGVSVWSTAQQLGVGMRTLQRWMASPVLRLRPVRVVDGGAARLVAFVRALS